VTINDDSWPTEAFELVTGEKTKTLERLDPWVHFVMHLSARGVSMYWTENDFIFFSFSGATASHTFVLETKTQGRFQGSPAIITYRVPTKTALQVLSFTLTLHNSVVFLMLCILYYPSLLSYLQLLDQFYCTKSMFIFWRRPTQLPSSHWIFLLREFRRRSLNG
jgi:hypothetical protein